MPITIQHQPDANLLSQAAYAAGQGEARQRTQEIQARFALARMAQRAQQQSQERAAELQAQRDAQLNQYHSQAYEQEAQDKFLKEQMQQQYGIQKEDLQGRYGLERERMQGESFLATEQERGRNSLLKTNADAAAHMQRTQYEALQRANQEFYKNQFAGADPIQTRMMNPAQRAEIAKINYQIMKTQTDYTLTPEQSTQAISELIAKKEVALSDLTSNPADRITAQQKFDQERAQGPNGEIVTPSKDGWHIAQPSFKDKELQWEQERHRQQMEREQEKHEEDIKLKRREAVMKHVQHARDAWAKINPDGVKQADGSYRTTPTNEEIQAQMQADQESILAWEKFEASQLPWVAKQSDLKKVPPGDWYENLITHVKAKYFPNTGAR